MQLMCLVGLTGVPVWDGIRFAALISMSPISLAARFGAGVFFFFFCLDWLIFSSAAFSALFVSIGSRTSIVHGRSLLPDSLVVRFVRLAVCLEDLCSNYN